MADAVVHKKNSIDRISSLPDDILLRIISFLSPNDTLRTRFLSTRFQKLWWSICFDCRDNLYLPDKFEKFIEKALSNHENLPWVQKFRLRCYHTTYTTAKIYKWIDSAVTASVSNLQELDIYVRRDRRGVKLPCSVFTCRKLRFLKLAGGVIVDEIPTGRVDFPCLKTLKLVSISILESISFVSAVLISSFCPVLEISHIEDCFLKNPLTSETLHLKYLEGLWVQGNCPNNLSKRDPTFRVLKHLELHDEDMFQIVKFKVRDGNPPVFQHLTHLKVKVDKEKRFSALPLLLQHSPNLTSLVLDKGSLERSPNSNCTEFSYFSQVFSHGHRRDIRNWEAPAATVFKCLSSNLETVQINEFYGSPEVKVVKYFLKNAKNLKKLVLCVERPLSDEIKASILDEPRASAQCEIEFWYPDKLMNNSKV
ncbi:hypothetical protein PTKIN_Ptkin11bG0172000 [Pterospermum kingtungense]